jgi:glyoxylase-like metal-dependent hydrolase (beta-lactamase superfamily II)
MKFSDRLFYRKMFFSLIMKEEPALREVYAALLKGSKNILVDCGVSYNYPDIVQFAAEAGLHLKDIDIIILTHCHADHTGGLFRLKQENPRLQIWSHPLGKAMIEDMDAQFKRRPVPAFHFLTGGSVPVDRVLNDGEVIDIGFEVKVLHTPGHSEDSLSLYLPEEKMIISGDAIPYIHDLPIYENLTALKASLNKLKKLHAENVISSFCGLWNNDEDIFEVTEKYLGQIQQAAEEYSKENPEASLTEIGRFVLSRINVEGLPIPIFLTTVKEHLKNSNSK